VDKEAPCGPWANRAEGRKKTNKERRTLRGGCCHQKRKKAVIPEGGKSGAQQGSKHDYRCVAGKEGRRLGLCPMGKRREGRKTEERG